MKLCKNKNESCFKESNPVIIFKGYTYHHRKLSSLELGPCRDNLKSKLLYLLLGK